MEEGWRSMNLYISDSYLHQFIKANQPVLQQNVSTDPPFEQINKLEIAATTRQLSQKLLACFSEEIAPAEAVLEQLFRELFLSVLADPRNQPLVGYLSRLAKKSRSSLYTVMETNFMYNLSLGEFAQLAHQSLPTFKRGFKRIFNTTPAQWLMHKRLVYAQILLKTTEKSIRDIVQESGFESGPHFSRVFKNQFGESPLRYRKQLVTS